MGQRYHARSHWGLKIPSDNDVYCQEEKETGKLHLTSVGWNLPGPRPAWLMQPQQGSFLMFPPPCSSFLFWKGHCHWHMLSGRDIFYVSLFSALSPSVHPVLTVYCWYCLKGKHFLGGTDLSSPSKVTAGIFDYLMGLADYEKACLLWGSWERENGQVDAWIWLNYAWTMHELLPFQQSHRGSDGRLQARIGTSSQQAGKSLQIVLPLAEDRELSISAGAGERNLHILPIPEISAWQKQLFFCIKQLCCKIAWLHQCRLSPEGF